jgi:hypothetical protein
MVNTPRKNAARNANAPEGADQSVGSARATDSVVLLESRRRSSAPLAVSRKSGTSSEAAKGKKSELSSQIGKELRGLYDEIVAQPIPDRFLELLNELESSAPSLTAKLETPGETE